MEKPFFSISFSAIRSDLYKRFYDTLSKGSTIPFEVIFVGYRPPTEKMPDNFKYIYTKVKPAQCVEIAVRNAEGEFIILSGDDMLFSENFLDTAYYWCNRIDSEKSNIAFRYSLGNEIKDDFLLFDHCSENSPIMGCAPCLKRTLWNKIGGFDRRFYGSMAELDLQMRIYEYGMSLFITPNCIIYERPYYHNLPTKDTSLYTRCGEASRDLLNQFWKNPDGSISKKRLVPFEPFEDKDILIKDQN